MNAKVMVIAVIASALFVGCASVKVKPTFDQSNQFFIEQAIDELNIGDALKNKIPITATVALVSMEISETLDHPIVATLEDQLLNSLLDSGYDVLERDPDILERLLHEKHEDTFSLIFTKEDFDYSFETVNVEPDLSPDFHATQLMGADYLISYRVLELGLSYREAEEKKYTEREAFVRLHVRVQNCETGKLVYADNLDATLKDEIRTEFVQQLANFHYSFFPHEFPLQPKSVKQAGPILKISEIDERSSGAPGGNAPAFYVGYGIDRFMFNDRDVLDNMGIESSFIGVAPRIGYQINQTFGVNVGYKFLIPQQGDNDSEWRQSAVHISCNISPFRSGDSGSFYFIAGLDMVATELKMDYYDPYGPSFDISSDDSETGVVFGIGYGRMLGSRFSINPEVTFVSGDYGGINLELGGRFYF
jgi:Outer membrane protein beta-barrel domain